MSRLLLDCRFVVTSPYGQVHCVAMLDCCSKMSQATIYDTHPWMYDMYGCVPDDMRPTQTGGARARFGQPCMITMSRQTADLVLPSNWTGLLLRNAKATCTPVCCLAVVRSDTGMPDGQKLYGVAHDAQRWMQ
jgi:hypothetical protein